MVHTPALQCDDEIFEKFHFLSIIRKKFSVSLFCGELQEHGVILGLTPLNYIQAMKYGNVILYLNLRAYSAFMPE